MDNHTLAIHLGGESLGNYYWVYRDGEKREGNLKTLHFEEDRVVIGLQLYSYGEIEEFILNIHEAVFHA